MLSDERIEQLELEVKVLRANNKGLKDKIDEQSKEIEELKASHITTNNKATNTEKAKIFDVIENSIDTYIEKSKPYWEQIMTKDEMTIEEALTIIDDMYQDKYKIMEQKTDTGVTIDLSKMDEITFTNLEFASVIVLREIQSLRHEIEKQSKEIEELKDESKEYQIGFAQGCYEKDLDWKDKIKAKIEEVEQWELYNMKIPRLSTLDERLGAKIGIKYVLQSLLEKKGE